MAANAAACRSHATPSKLALSPAGISGSKFPSVTPLPSSRSGLSTVQAAVALRMLWLQGYRHPFNPSVSCATCIVLCMPTLYKTAEPSCIDCYQGQPESGEQGKLQPRKHREQRAYCPRSRAALDLDGAHKPDKKDVGSYHCPDAWRACSKVGLGPVVYIVRVIGADSLSC